MSGAHFHLVLNHLPTLGVPVGVLIFFVAFMLGNKSMLRFGLGFVAVASLLVLPVFWTGEPAEHVIEHLPGVSEDIIEVHEEFAEATLAVTLASGIIASAAFLIVTRKPLWTRGAVAAALVASLASSVMLARTAYLGGQIRHTELRPGVNIEAAKPDTSELPDAEDAE